MMLMMRMMGMVSLFFKSLLFRVIDGSKAEEVPSWKRLLASVNSCLRRGAILRTGSASVPIQEGPLSSLSYSSPPPLSLCLSSSFHSNPSRDPLSN
jgi:hypothetical protein